MLIYNGYINEFVWNFIVLSRIQHVSIIQLIDKIREVEIV